MVLMFIMQLFSKRFELKKKILFTQEFMKMNYQWVIKYLVNQDFIVISKPLDQVLIQEKKAPLPYIILKFESHRYIATL